MSLNIKDDATHAMARELAHLTGESMTRAVNEAIRERLDRVRSRRREGMAKRLLRIGEDCAAHLPRRIRTLDHGELLYDEKGLPR